MTCGHQWMFRDAGSRPITREQRDELVKPRSGRRSGGEAEERRAQGRRREQYKQEMSEMTKPKEKPKGKSSAKKPVAKRSASKTKGDLDSRIPKVGTVLKAKYKGEEYTAKVTQDGFEFKCEQYCSISKVGSIIMGGKACNGYKLFGLS